MVLSSGVSRFLKTYCVVLLVDVVSDAAVSSLVEVILSSVSAILSSVDVVPSVILSVGVSVTEVEVGDVVDVGSILRSIPVKHLILNTQSRHTGLLLVTSLAGSSNV